jgi:hypothetical protein
MWSAARCLISASRALSKSKTSCVVVPWQRGPGSQPHLHADALYGRRGTGVPQVIVSTTTSTHAETSLAQVTWTPPPAAWQAAPPGSVACMVALLCPG